MNIENKTREDLIEEICRLENSNPKEYENWTTEELQELALNLNY